MRVIRLALAAALALAGPAHGAGCSGAAGNDVCETARSGPAPAAVAASAAGKARAQSKRAPGSRKVHPAIDEMVSAIEARQSAGPRSAGRPAAPEGGGDLSGVFVRVDASGAIQVHVLLTEFTEANVAGLEALGLRVELTLPRRRLVQGWLPAGAVGAVAALDCVRAVKPPGYPVRSGAGVVTTAGDSILGAAAARSAFGVTGAGVKVGVISDGVDHLASSVQTGDLPPDVAVVKAGSGDEGTAMLEIVHDLAPGAPLAFYGPSTDAEMVVAIETLAAVGSRVAVDDLGLFTEPKFEDGMVAEAIRSFATDGRVYVSAAGNQAQQHYRSPYNRLTGQDFPSSEWPGVHNYAPGALDIGNTLVVPPSCVLSVVLQWNNPFGAASDDFDLFIGRSSDLAILAASTAAQTGTQDPLEFAAFKNTTGAPLAVFVAVSEFHLESPPASLLLDYFALVDCVDNPGLQYVTAAESLTGNHALEEAMPVAAVSAASPSVAEAYSSQGPATISFPQPEARNVPVLTAVDCVATETGALGFAGFPFCGTSASAPHVAGIAALLIEAAPTLWSEQLRQILSETATDLGPPGFDFTYGFGRVDAFAALEFTLSAPHVGLGLSLGAQSVAPGDTVQVALFEANAGAATTQDLYLGVIPPPAVSVSLGCPGGDALVLLADGFTRQVVVCLSTSSPQAFAPLFKGLAVPAALPPTPVWGFSFAWTLGIPPGGYTFVTFSTPPGAFADGRVDPGDITAVAVGSLEASP